MLFFVNEEKERTQELAEDLVVIVTSFAAKIYGKIGSLRQELKGEIEALRQEVRGEIKVLKMWIFFLRALMVVLNQNSLEFIAKILGNIFK